MENINNFTDEQLKTYNLILEFLETPYKNFYLIEGYAGTGKTYLTTKLVHELVKNKIRVAITAPTHKAVKVLFNEAGRINNEYIIFSTIHSILGLNEYIDGFGKQSFKPMPGKEPKIKDYNVLIIDETSMLDDELFHHLLPYIDKGLKIIFVGDPCQIPPVNRMDCIPFTKQEQIKYDIEKNKLYNIVRQAKDNPIIQTTFDIRKDIGKIDILNIFDKNNINLQTKQGVYLFRDNIIIDQNKIIQLIYDLFLSDEYKNNQDHIRVIAWRNETVNIYNQIIRQMLYGDDVQKITVDEHLILNSPIFDQENPDEILLNTNEELTVLNFTIEYEYINYGKQRIYYYNTNVKSFDLFNRPIFNTIQILTSEGEIYYNEYLERLRKEAMNERQGSEKARMRWIEYFEFKKHFAQVNYNYSLTIHKSQGSTYDNVIVHAWDILANLNIEERNRILYTACSRPRYNLYLVK